MSSVLKLGVVGAPVAAAHNIDWAWFPVSSATSASKSITVPILNAFPLCFVYQYDRGLRGDIGDLGLTGLFGDGCDAGAGAGQAGVYHAGV